MLTPPSGLLSESLGQHGARVAQEQCLRDDVIADWR